jgi:phospholipid/cholesterol/gamma-HCH transport system substrate-binding protein
MAKKSTETWVGVFVVLGILALVFLALKAANLATFTATKGYQVRARFDNIGGLKVHAPVRSAGVAVGHVTGITLDKNTYQGVVTMEITKGVSFPDDSSAQILTSGLLGDQYVGIEPGSDEKELQAGDQIKNTQSAVVLEKLIGQMIFNKAADAGGGTSPAPAGAAPPSGASALAPSPAEPAGPASGATPSKPLSSASAGAHS